MTKEQFDNRNLKITKEALAEAQPEELRANKIINQLGSGFTFAKFKALFKGEVEEQVPNMSDNIEEVFEHYIKDHPKLSQGTIDSYKTIINHLVSFKKNIHISDLTVDFIRSFLIELKKTSSVKAGTELKKTSGVKSDATINIYLRSLRAIYNYAQVRLNLDPRNNPFGRNKIEISSNTNVKKAINEKDFQKLLSYKPNGKKEEFAHDMFLISFGLTGMNIADIISIKNNEIGKGNVLTYYRKKTQNRQKTVTPISIIINKTILELIKKHGAINPDAPEDYVFPFLKAGMSEKQELRKRKDITKQINKSLKEICEHIGIEKITTYSARHTIATMLMNSSVTVEAISKSLGHKSIKTTQNYLSQLSDKIISDISEKTSSFMAIDNKNNGEDETIVVADPVLVD